jgi:hypothetical protein
MKRNYCPNTGCFAMAAQVRASNPQEVGKNELQLVVPTRAQRHRGHVVGRGRRLVGANAGAAACQRGTLAPEKAEFYLPQPP